MKMTMTHSPFPLSLTLTHTHTNTLPMYPNYFRKMIPFVSEAHFEIGGEDMVYKLLGTNWRRMREVWCYP